MYYTINLLKDATQGLYVMQSNYKNKSWVFKKYASSFQYYPEQKKEKKKLSKAYALPNTFMFLMFSRVFLITSPLYVYTFSSASN